jgi:hypothetical protein
MTTLPQAQMRLSQLLAERRRDGKSNELTQIDAVLGEDFETVHCWLYFRDGSDALIPVDFAGPIDPAAFDADRFAAALTALPSLARH